MADQFKVNKTAAWLGGLLESARTGLKPVSNAIDGAQDWATNKAMSAYTDYAPQAVQTGINKVGQGISAVTTGWDNLTANPNGSNPYGVIGGQGVIPGMGIVGGAAKVVKAGRAASGIAKAAPRVVKTVQKAPAVVNSVAPQVAKVVPQGPRALPYMTQSGANANAFKQATTGSENAMSFALPRAETGLARLNQVPAKIGQFPARVNQVPAKVNQMPAKVGNTSKIPKSDVRSSLPAKVKGGDNFPAKAGKGRDWGWAKEAAAVLGGATVIAGLAEYYNEGGREANASSKPQSKPGITPEKNPTPPAKKSSPNINNDRSHTPETNPANRSKSGGGSTKPADKPGIKGSGVAPAVTKAVTKLEGPKAIPTYGEMAKNYDGHSDLISGDDRQRMQEIQRAPTAPIEGRKLPKSSYNTKILARKLGGILQVK